MEQNNALPQQILEEPVMNTPGTFARDDEAWLQEVEQVVMLAGAHD